MITKNLILALTIVFSTAGFCKTDRHFNSELAKELGLNVGDHITSALQDRTDGGFEKLMSELQRVHKAVYALPYSYDHIRTVFMTEIEAKKKEIAPHYPSREATGENQEEAYRLFREWYINYPEECTAYITYVDQFVAEHSK